MSSLTTCDAPIDKAPGIFGFIPVVCRQVVGVKTYISTGGLRVGYCSRDGHEAAVRRQYAEQADIPEPSWDLGRDPGYDDPPDAIDQYKGWTESEKAYGR